MEKREKLSPAQVREFYKEQGVSETRLQSLAVSINRIPESGKFGLPTVGKIPNEAGETIYPAIEVLNNEDVIVGSVAVGSIYAGEAIPVLRDLNKGGETPESVIEVETQQIRKVGKNNNKFMVRSMQLNNLAKFGSSQEMVVANLYGKTFKTRPKKTVVARVLADSSHFKATAAEAAKQFDIKTIYHFDIE
jgi:hypothetical protein